MGRIRVRFILVALVVSTFAIGMAAFLNYFKYKSTFGGVVRERVLVIGRGIENSVQTSLSLGMQFTELAALPTQISREQAADKIILGIDVFDHTGTAIYSTDRSRVGRGVPEGWVAAADRSKTNEWSLEEPDQYVAGISVKNSFNLTVGYVALRYSRDTVDHATASAGREILFSSLMALVGIAVIAPLALIVVIRRFERDLSALEHATTDLEDTDKSIPRAHSAFDMQIATLRASLREADNALDDLREKMDSSRTMTIRS
jgi:uncharacterized protein involved in exopolysaccharide biosynthesis